MPKRKREQKGEGAPTQPFELSLEERWDTDVVNSLMELVLNSRSEDVLGHVAQQLQAQKGSQFPGSRVRVTYKPSEDFPQGRVYGKGFQGAPKWIRRLCSYKYYHDLDMMNCGPKIIAQVLVKVIGKCPALIKTYANDRAAMFVSLREEEPELINTPDSELKTLFLKVFHGGNYRHYLASLGLNVDHPPIMLLEHFTKSVRKAMKKLKKHPDFQRLSPDIGTFTSQVWQKVENEILLVMCEYLRKREDLTPGVLVFDGIMVERKSAHPAQLDPAILRRCESYIKDKTGFSIKLTEKSLTPTAEDWELFWGEKALNKIKNDESKQLYLLAREGQLKGFKREGEWLMEPHNLIPGVFMRTDEDCEYINRALKGYHLFRGGNMKKLQQWFSSVDHPMFELLTPAKMKTGAISFLNGYLDLTSMLFHSWADVKSPPLTNHYFEQKMELSAAMNGPTPLWDSLLETQLGKRSTNFEEGTELTMCDMLEVLIGRLFYPIGEYDNWQVMPFLKGDANTGKGTVCDLIKRMFPTGTTGVITATQEQTFGLEALFSKRLVVIPDLPKKFSKIINQSDFQSMVSGEGVSVARKNKTAISDQAWKVPIVGAGNYLPDYNDNSGSISRRLSVFPFATLITSRDTTLKDQVVKNELVTIIIRCIARYRVICDRYKTLDFWTKIAPAPLREVQREVKESTNYLANFLKNGDDYYQILYVKGQITPMEKLESAFSNHMRFKQKLEKAKIGEDKHPIKAAGYTIEKVNLCKVCHVKATKANCGEHYDGKNRYKKLVIHNMQINSL